MIQMAGSWRCDRGPKMAASVSRGSALCEIVVDGSPLKYAEALIFQAANCTQKVSLLIIQCFIGINERGVSFYVLE